VRFLEQTVQHPCYGDSAWTYSDVERALQAWLQADGTLDRYRQRLADETEAAERAELARLQQKYAQQDTDFRLVAANDLQRKETYMTDPTESVRRQRLAEINAQPGSREALEAQYGRTWDTNELRQDFDVLGFAAPLVVVRRKADGIRRSLEFQHAPRFYFSFQPE
jgi:hypothetical protein